MLPKKPILGMQTHAFTKEKLSEQKPEKLTTQETHRTIFGGALFLALDTASRSHIGRLIN